MKTYAEYKSEEYFDWNKALHQDPNKIDWDHLEELSSNWVTCACGNQCDIIPRFNCGTPKDAVLELLGGQSGFTAAIEDNDVEKALAFLEAIESRSTILIQIELDKLKA